MEFVLLSLLATAVLLAIELFEMLAGERRVRVTMRYVLPPNVLALPRAPVRTAHPTGGHPFDQAA
jgi:hypothetical protein